MFILFLIQALGVFLNAKTYILESTSNALFENDHDSSQSIQNLLLRQL